MSHNEDFKDLFRYLNEEQYDLIKAKKAIYRKQDQLDLEKLEESET